MSKKEKINKILEIFDLVSEMWEKDGKVTVINYFDRIKQ